MLGILQRVAEQLAEARRLLKDERSEEITEDGGLRGNAGVASINVRRCMRYLEAIMRERVG